MNTDLESLTNGVPMVAIPVANEHAVSIRYLVLASIYEQVVGLYLFHC